MNPQHELRVLEAPETDDIIAGMGLSSEGLTPQVITDLVRLDVLSREGGVWVDATLLPVEPLDAWLPQTGNGFFAFRAPSSELLLSSWFLHAEAGHPLVQNWRDAYAEYFSVPRRWPTWRRALWHARPIDYLRFRAAQRRGDHAWFTDPARGRRSLFFPYPAIHYNFAWILDRDPALRALWDAVPRRHAILPHVVQRAAEHTPADLFQACLPELLSVSPVHKLNSRGILMSMAVEHVLNSKFRSLHGCSGFSP